jgi:epoxyqueuosine reductase
MQPGNSIENQIKLHAADIGFDLSRITSADQPPHHHEFQNWLENGFNGEMHYLERHEPKRADLSKVLPNAKSVVCVALSYAQDEDVNRQNVEEDNPDTGVIARYARLNDYHNIMWAKLENLLASINLLIPDVNGKVYCDTGPVSERDLAERAGIGWVGKHGSLISRKLGNWFFLGEIILDIELKPDQPESKHCGSSACPTQAIVAPYKLDARRCISYLTIELKGSIPIELRTLIGNRIFGCDDCLAVCPWNKFAKAAQSPELKARHDLKAPDLIDLLKLDENQFKQKFENSPILRTKRRGLARNVCVALGNSGNKESIPALNEAAVNDPEELVREHARWAIDRLEGRA